MFLAIIFVSIRRSYTDKDRISFYFYGFSNRNFSFLSNQLNNSFPFSKQQKPNILENLLGISYIDIDLTFDFYRESDILVPFLNSVQKPEYDQLNNMLIAETSYIFLFDGQYIGCQMGFVNNSEIFIHNQFEFIIHVNSKDQIEETYVKPVNSMVVDVGIRLDINFKAIFIKSSTSGSKKYDLINDKRFFATNYHKAAMIIAIFQSIALVIVVLLILRRMFADFDHSTSIKDFDDFDFQSTSDRGWKILHGDVFRPPKSSGLLTVLISTGFHLGVALFFFLSISRSLFAESYLMLAIIFICVFSVSTLAN